MIIAREVQLDALPYVDQGYEEPGGREAESEEMEENRVRDVLTYCTSAFTLCTVHTCSSNCLFISPSSSLPSGYASCGGGDSEVQAH